ncbi:MAG: 5-formyltetrahydrofolate cyclo-ligase [Burkholderiales bacterium]|nr:5-formyltetrahydrofolate cyclo-ligase [Burkholderiales bacterium]
MSTPADLAAWRKAQRAELLARREAVPLAQRRGWNEAVTRHLIEGFSAVLEQRWVGFCWPYKGEPDARFFVYHLRKRGARAALPAVIAKKGPLQFREWWPGVTMAPGVFDLPVPQGTAIVIPQALLIPPVGFDGCGYRLGYGGGYFDRTLAAMAPQPLKIGVGFEIARMQTIHPQPYDIAMDFIVTESGVYRVQNRMLPRLAGGEEVRAAAAAILRERGMA